MPLADVKAVGKALGCSINDVLLASCAGAIGEYLKSHGDDTAGKEIRAMVPVNLRPLDKAYQLGNRFGLVPLVLPIGVDNPVERVAAVRRRMNALKGSYQPLLAFGVLAIAGLLVKPAQAALLNTFAKKATAVMTNVPGPGVAMKFCGATLRQTMFWVPQSRRHRHGRQHPELCGRRAVRSDHRPQAVPRPAGHHRPLRARVREAVVGDDDVAVGRGRLTFGNRIANAISRSQRLPGSL